MSDDATDQAREEAAGWHAFQNAPVIWTRPTACLLASDDALICLQALLYAGATQSHGRMDIDLATRLIKHMHGQNLAEGVEFLAWDGEYAMIRGALRYLAGSQQLEESEHERLDAELLLCQEAAREQQHQVVVAAAAQAGDQN